MIHGQPVAHRDGGKFHRRAAGHTDARFDGFGNLIKMYMTWYDFIGRVDHADKRPPHFLPRHSQSIQQ